jgi:hypothetical protein
MLTEITVNSGQKRQKEEHNQQNKVTKEDIRETSINEQKGRWETGKLERKKERMNGRKRNSNCYVMDRVPITCAI